MPDVLELVLRGGAATTFLLLSLILLRDGGDRTMARLGALFAASTAAWALNTPPFSSWSYRWALPLVLVSYGKTAAFWLFSRALFEDDFRLRRLDWAVWGAMVVLGSAWYLGVRLGYGAATDPARIPFQVGQILLAGSAAWIAWRGRGGDLVEPRRRARMMFVLLSSALMIGITISYLAPGKPPPLVTDLNVARMLVMAIAMALLVAGFRSPGMARSSSPSARPRADECGGVRPPDAAEARLLVRLERLMAEERAYRLEGLTIGALASRAGAPEYALRRLINGRLGYRNFSAYLNQWRLAEAKAALLDPAQREVPISTIALDAGFSSLGPFNRAFKASVGVTPSAFRQGARSAAPGGVSAPILKSA